MEEVVKALKTQTMPYHTGNPYDVLDPGVADNLNWIEDDFRNLKEAMQQRGKPVSDLRVETASDAQRAAAEAAPPAPAPEREAERSVAPLDGISEDQAQRIRDAVRASKQRRAADKARARAEASEAPSESGG